MKKSGSQKSQSPSQLIDARIKELDWRDEMLSRLRSLVKEADPEVVEEWSGEGFRCGSTTELSAPARLTRTSLR